MVVCGIPTWECDSNDVLIVYIRLLLLLLLLLLLFLFSRCFVKAVITSKNWQFKLCDTGDEQPYVFLCCVQQTNVWVESIAILMGIRLSRIQISVCIPTISDRIFVGFP